VHGVNCELTGVNWPVHGCGLTIEPGLYFPDRELGVCIEDTFVVRDDGVQTLCRSSYGLEP
jgi:Xaa-Pro aminopeptidase